jgi:hypothetical protein
VFELHNPGPAPIECFVQGRRILVEPDEYLPTEGHEKMGITAGDFADKGYVAKSFLHRTAPAVRRRLLDARNPSSPKASSPPLSSPSPSEGAQVKAGGVAVSASPPEMPPSARSRLEKMENPGVEAISAAMNEAASTRRK